MAAEAVVLPMVLPQLQSHESPAATARPAAQRQRPTKPATCSALWLAARWYRRLPGRRSRSWRCCQGLVPRDEQDQCVCIRGRCGQPVGAPPSRRRWGLCFRCSPRRFHRRAMQLTGPTLPPTQRQSRLWGGAHPFRYRAPLNLRPPLFLPVAAALSPTGGALSLGAAVDQSEGGSYAREPSAPRSTLPINKQIPTNSKNAQRRVAVWCCGRPLGLDGEPA
jgi:hypothetical protein